MQFKKMNKKQRAFFVQSVKVFINLDLIPKNIDFHDNLEYNII